MRCRTVMTGGGLALAFFLGGAQAALATDVHVTSSGSLLVMAQPGEKNAITISGGAGGQVVVDDTGAAVVPVPSGCVAASPSQATCSGVLRIVVDAGDLDDGVRNDTAVPSTLSGGVGHDTLIGGSASDLLRGGGDLDILDGREGDDVFDVRGGIADQVTCGPGNDRVIGDAHDTVNVDCETVDRGTTPPVQGEAPPPPPFVTTPGQQPIVAPSQPGTPAPIDVTSQIGGKTLGANECVTQFSGTAGNDRIDGTNGGDRMFGLAGDDVLNGLGGNDCLFGSAGKDRLYAGAGNDTASGGIGADRVEGGSGNDQLFGNAGGDRLFGQTGDDRLSGGDGNDRVDGGSGRDTLVAGKGRDQLIGGTGNDSLKGGPGGRDVLDGGSGNDTIDARNHVRDVVNCGSGRDTARVDRVDRVRGCERIVRSGH
jgi:Ca2+-binding RTX toxin-like protein